MKQKKLKLITVLFLVLGPASILAQEGIRLQAVMLPAADLYNMLVNSTGEVLYSTYIKIPAVMNTDGLLH